MNNYRRPCYIIGIAYDNLLWNENDNNGGYLSDEVYKAWPTHDNSTMVQCNVSSTQEALYSEPAVRLTLRDVEQMAIENAPITEEHTGKTVGKVNKKWIDNGKLMVEAHINDLDTAEKARRGKYTGFSVGYVFDTVGKRVTKKIFNHLAVCEDPVFDKCRFVVTASKTMTTTTTNANQTEGGNSQPFMTKSVSSGIRIESVNDNPLKMQNNISGGDKYGGARTFNDLAASKTTRMENQAQQSPFGGQGSANTEGGQIPQQQQTQNSIPSFHSSQQAPPQQQQQQPSAPPQQQFDAEQDRSDPNGKDRSRAEGTGLSDEEIRSVLLKKEKMRMLKEENRALKSREDQRLQEYLKGQEPKKKAFVEFARGLNNGELSGDVEDVIENSYTTAGYEGWTSFMEKVASEHVQMKEALEREREARGNIERENNELKRKSEKQRNLFKYMKGESGERKKVSFDDERRETGGGGGSEEKPGLFNKRSPNGFSSAPHINAKTPKIENIFSKQQRQPQAPPQMSTGRRETPASGQHQQQQQHQPQQQTGGFLDDARRHGVTASRGTSSSAPTIASFGGFNTREEGGVLNQLHPELWDVFNKTANVDPKADAYEYLVKTQNTTGIPVVRYSYSH